MFATLKKNIGIVVLCGLAVFLFFLMLVTQIVLEQQELREVAPPSTVLNFLTEFIPARALADQESIVEKYFSTIDSSDLRYDGSSQDLLNIDAVFRQATSRAKSFRICSSYKNYLEIMLVGDDGKDLPCRIGFFFLIGSDGKISSYSFTRLQPVSRKDTEWRKEWQ